MHYRFVATILLGLWALPLSAAPGLTPAGYSYPLDGITTEADLQPRLMTGGCWLAGLPGMPRYNGRNVHAGVDVRAKLGDLVYAVCAGVVDPASDVIHSGYGPGWGPGYVILVRCQFPDGTPFIMIYGHTQNHRVKGGDGVRPGQLLGEIGPWLDSEGGPHLHLTIRLGELPRWGWGTPTMAGNPAREGAEVVSCAQDVEALGYRNPLEFLKGNLRTATVATTAMVAPLNVDEARFLNLVGRFWQTRQLQRQPQPRADCFSRTDRPVRVAGGWLQTFARGTEAAGALMCGGGTEQVYWVSEPLWTIYNLQGGPLQLGYPNGEARDWPEAYAQSFQNGLLVLEKNSQRVRVIRR